MGSGHVCGMWGLTMWDSPRVNRSGTSTPAIWWAKCANFGTQCCGDDCGGDDRGRQAGTQVAASTMIMVATSRVSWRFLRQGPRVTGTRIGRDFIHRPRSDLVGLVEVNPRVAFLLQSVLPKTWGCALCGTQCHNNALC